MSKILDLAKSFEQTSSEQAKDTEQVVATEFKKHEQRLKDLLQRKRESNELRYPRAEQTVTPDYVKNLEHRSHSRDHSHFSDVGNPSLSEPQNRQERRDNRPTEPSYTGLSEQGGNIKLKDCIDNKDRKRLCVLVNKDAPTWQNGSLMVPMGY